jgi:hypothetical protein
MVLIGIPIGLLVMAGSVGLMIRIFRWAAGF